MNYPKVKIGSVVLLKRNTWHYKFRHKSTCRFFKNPHIRNIPLVRISRISTLWPVGKVFWFHLVGKVFWFYKMCNCFPAAHIHEIKKRGRIKIVIRKTSCPIQLEHCELFNKAAQ